MVLSAAWTALIIAIVVEQAHQAVCYATKGAPAKISQSSLNLCYRDNDISCCNQAVDGYITSFYSSYFTSNCLRLFPDFEIYNCLACNQYQPKATLNGTIIICETFATRIWGGDITKPSKAFDLCGISTGITPNDETVVPPVYRSYSTPSVKYANAQAFFDDHKPPFFEKLNVVIDKTNSDKCWNSALNFVVMPLSLLFVTFWSIF